MARTRKADVIIPELWDEAIQGAFSGRNAFVGSTLVASGAAIVRGDMPAGQPEIGNEINVPYFGTIGEFAELTDGDAAEPKRLLQAQEVATVGRAALAFEPTRWARNSAGGDIYEEGVRQMREAALRKMDLSLIDKAKAAGVPTVDLYSTTSPRFLDHSALVQGKMLYGDEFDQNIAAMVVHSDAAGKIMSQMDSTGRPLYVPEITEAGGLKYAGIPLVVSDRMPLDGSTMSAVVSAGTTPPAVTLTGTPTGPWKLQIDIVVGGARGTATFRFSVDGGNTWSQTLLTAATVALNDSTTIDSMVGIHGLTGLTAGFANDTYNADNLYTASANLKHTSLIVKKGALAFWFNSGALQLQTDRDILADSDVAAMHLYYAAHRYRRPRGSARHGVVKIVHN